MSVGENPLFFSAVSYSPFAMLKMVSLEELLDNLQAMDSGIWYRRGMVRIGVYVEQFVIFFPKWLVGFFFETKSYIEKIYFFQVGFDFNFKSYLFEDSYNVFPSSVFDLLQFLRIMSPSSRYKPVSFLFIFSAKIDNIYFQPAQVFLHCRSFPLSCQSFLVTFSLSMVFPCQIAKIFLDGRH